MESNKTYKTLKDIAEKELDELTRKGTLSPTEVDTAKNAVCLIKEINELIRQDEWHDESSGCHNRMYYPNMEYSYGFYPRYDMHSYGDYPYYTSMARGRDAATGRYISRGDDMTSGRRMYGSFSYDGRSGHSIEDRVIDKIEQMMDSAQSNYERERLKQFIRVIDSMKGE